MSALPAVALLADGLMRAAQPAAEPRMSKSDYDKKLAEMRKKYGNSVAGETTMTLEVKLKFLPI